MGMLHLFANALLMALLLLTASLAVGFGWLRMMGMYLEREITGEELAVWSIVYMAAFGTTLAAWGTPACPLLALMTLALALVYPVGTYLAEKRGLQRMRQEDIVASFQALKERPDVPYPYRKLGDIFYASGDFGLAAKYYQAYLGKTKEAKLTARLRECERQQRLQATKARICLQCEAENPHGATHCMECGEPFPGLWEILEQFRSHRGMSVLLWTVGISMGLGLVLSFLGILHTILAAGLYLIAICGLFIYLYIRIALA